MELRLTRDEITQILEEWAHNVGYATVECVDLFHMDGEEVCEAVLTVEVPPGLWQPEVPFLDDSPELSIFRGASGKYRVEYSLQDEGPRAYEEEFDTEDEALLFIEEEEKRNPLKGTMMYHLVDPTGHVRHVRV